MEKILLRYLVMNLFSRSKRMREKEKWPSEKQTKTKKFGRKIVQSEKVA